MQQRKMNLEQKIVLIIIVLSTVGFGLLGFLSYHQIENIIVQQNKEEAMEIASAAAKSVSGDLFEQIDSPDSEAYREVYDNLSNYKVNQLVSYIYAMREDGNRLVFVVDTDEKAPAGFLEEYEYLEDMRPAFRGVVSCDSKVTKDKWGTFFSAYAPIRTKDGKVVGIVGCDVRVQFIRATMGRMARDIVSLIILFAIASGLCYILLSRAIMSRDVLTGIPNYERLLRYGALLRRKKTLHTYTGMLINIKDFKYVNQRYNSKAGGLVLREYALLLLAYKERQGYVASTGSDNFFALIKKGKEQEFLSHIQKAEVMIGDKNDPILVPVSVRCGLYAIKEEDDINTVLNACTFALKNAKKKNSNDVEWFEDNMFDEMNTEKELLGAFRTGIVRHEFVVYYQPKVNIYTNDLYGAEALVRWYRNGKIVPPGQFIPILEKNNMITELDFYVLEQVCQDINSWLKEGLAPVKISTNFSKLHLSNQHFADDILGVLKKYCVDPKYVEAELTESSSYYDLDALTRFVNSMNEAELSVSIDDFGTGYSSLSLLMDLNVNVVKLDKSFFRDIEVGDRTNEKMVENIIRMVQDLGKEIISEGIETPKQSAFLKRMHSPIVQGYLYDKPLPHGEFEKKLKNPHYDLESSEETTEAAEKKPAEEKATEKKPVSEQKEPEAVKEEKAAEEKTAEKKEPEVVKEEKKAEQREPLKKDNKIYPIEWTR